MSRRVSKFNIVVPFAKNRNLLVNTLTGAIDIVDEDIITSLTDSNLSSLPEEIMAHFNERGYISTENQEKIRQEELLRLCDEERRTASKLTKFVIMLTYNCNLRCSYCYENPVRRRGKEWIEKTLTKEEVNKIFKAIEQLHNPNNELLPITLFGGEPLLPGTKDALKYVFDKGTDYSFNIFTNGVNLKDFVGLLSRFDNLETIFVSFYGLKETHDNVRIKADGSGSFDDIVQGVDAAKDAGLKIMIDFNLDERTLPTLHSFCQFLRNREWTKGFGITSVLICGDGCRPSADPEDILKKLSSIGEGDRIIERILSRYLPPMFRKHLFGEKRTGLLLWACPGLINDFYVFDPHGDVYSPCLRVVGEPGFKCGRYLPSLVIDEKKEILRKRDVFSIPECRECKYAFLCGGGCVYSAYKSTGSFFKPSCSLFKASMKYVTPFFLMKKYGGKKD